jgi:CBS domain-containing protein
MSGAKRIAPVSHTVIPLLRLTAINEPPAGASSFVRKDGDPMFDRLVGSIMQREVLVAAPGTSVHEAAGRMAQRNVGAVLVAEEERLVGIFTERDLLRRVVAAGLDPRATRLAEVMTRAPRTISPATRFGEALVLMQECGFRHLPVVEDGKPLGMVSARHAMDPDLEEFRSETSRREYWKKGGAAKR